MPVISWQSKSLYRGSGSSIYRIKPAVYELWAQAGNGATEEVRYGSPYSGRPPRLYGDGIYGQATTGALGVAVAERVPVVGGDIDAWGVIMNGFLGVGHAADGELKYKGEATWAVGVTTLVVTHGATFGNSTYNVQLTHTENLGEVWIPTRTATTFTMECSGTPDGTETTMWVASPDE